MLLGRYERCGILLAKNYNNLSRVHLLLVRLGEEVVAIDTASTNGTWRGAQEVHTTTLRAPDSLKLGEQLRLRWRLLSQGSSAGEA